MDTPFIQQVNRALSALGIAITGAGSATFSWFNTFQFIADGLISPFVSPAAAPGLATATKIAPYPNGVPVIAGNLAGDNGSVDTGIKSCRIYTLVATLPLNDGSTVPTFSLLAGEDFSKYEFPSTKYIALPNQPNQAAVGFVIVKNGAAGVFIPGTTHLDAAGVTVEYIEYSVFLGTGSALANGSIWIGDGGGNAVARTLSGDATVSNTGVVTVTGATGNFTTGGKVIGHVTSSSGPAAIAITGSQHQISATGAADAMTLADGTAGQELTILYVAEVAGGNSAVVTPTNLAGGNTITFSNLGDSASLRFSATGGWYVVALNGAVLA